MISIHWHKRAVAQLYQVEDYILRDFGEKVRKEFMNIEVLLFAVNKIVYYIDNNTLHIAAFWDTRKEPKRQARKTP